MGVKSIGTNEMQVDNTFGIIWLPVIGISLFLFAIGLLFFPQAIGGKGDPLLAAIVVLGMSLIAILMWAIHWVRIKISKTTGLVEIKKIFKSESYKISQIKKLELVQELSTSTSRGTRTIQYFLYLSFDDGMKQKFQDITRNQQEASQIAAFLSVPFEYRPLPSMSEAIRMTEDLLKSRMEDARQQYAKKQEEGQK